MAFTSTRAAASAASDAALERAKDLYLSAAYEDALAALGSVRTDVSVSEAVEVAEYRVFCLLALSRRAEADAIIQRMVEADPWYQLSEAQASPRIRAVFRDVRRNVLPAVVQVVYADAKSAFDRKDPQATAKFTRLIALLDDPDLAGQATSADLRTLATGFRDLSAAMAPAPPLPAAGLASTSGPQALVASLPDAGEDIRVIPPEALSQPVPPWQPVNRTDRGPFTGTLQLQIDERGTVVDATLVTRVHPSYDNQLLKMARTWRFKPATRNGLPIPYVKVLTITLQP
jgi:TonB family protein